MMMTRGLGADQTLRPPVLIFKGRQSQTFGLDVRGPF